MMTIASPYFALLLFLPLLMIYLAKMFNKRSRSSFRFSSTDFMKGVRPSLKAVMADNLIFLRALALVFIVLALMRPRIPIEETKIYVEGIDIVMAVDTSTSMRAMDFEINGKRHDRLYVVKKAMEDFIRKRPDDKIGIVAFAASAYTLCPLTLDHDWLEKNMDRLKIGMIEDGTSIGSAISASLNRLKKTKAKSKIIILLTDGRNNAGKISPLTAADVAKALGVRIYCIGAGTKGLAPYPVKNMFGETVLQPVEIDIDEHLLKEIASRTGGMYFRATDTKSLEDIYNEIDKLEKTKIEEVGYRRYHELFPKVLFPAMVILLLEMILADSVLRRIP